MTSTQSRTFLNAVFVPLLVIGFFTFARPESAVLRAQESRVERYNLGEATILQARFPDESRFHKMPVTIQGIISLPDGAGPFPVALIIHGSYAFCSSPLIDDVDVYPCPPEADLRQYEGFAYLAQALADHGYIVLIPDLSAEYNNGFGEPAFAERSIQIIEAHLSALASAEGFETDVAGKADLDRLFVVTHSRGGPIVVRYLTDTVYANRTARGLFLLAPAPIAQGETLPVTLPAAVVIAECDGDVGTEGPLFFRDAQLPALRAAVTLTYTMESGTHNAFSTRLGDDPSNPCEGRVLLDPETQQMITASLVSSFLDFVQETTRR